MSEKRKCLRKGILGVHKDPGPSVGSTCSTLRRSTQSFQRDLSRNPVILLSLKHQWGFDSERRQGWKLKGHSQDSLSRTPIILYVGKSNGTCHFTYVYWTHLSYKKIKNLIFIRFKKFNTRVVYVLSLDSLITSLLPWWRNFRHGPTVHGTYLVVTLKMYRDRRTRQESVAQGGVLRLYLW